MSATLTTTASGGRAAGSQGVSDGSRGDPKAGEPDPVAAAGRPRAGDAPVRDRLRQRATTAASPARKPVGQPENFRCAFNFAQGNAGAPRDRPLPPLRARGRLGGRFGTETGSRCRSGCGCSAIRARPARAWRAPCGPGRRPSGRGGASRRPTSGRRSRGAGRRCRDARRAEEELELAHGEAGAPAFDQDLELRRGGSRGWRSRRCAVATGSRRGTSAASWPRAPELVNEPVSKWRRSLVPAFTSSYPDSYAAFT